jgi:hypothetical protein
MVSLQEKQLLTERGRSWIGQFATEDREIASRLVESLTLVSKSKFERSVSRLIQDTAAAIAAPVALFAVRELNGTMRSEFNLALSQSSRRSMIDATPRGNDLGSEARVAAMIRSLSTASSGLLNHPNVAMMRAQLSRCKAIILVDDLVGSGDRAAGYLAALWENRTIRSWWSRKHIQFFVISFAATEEGEKHLRKLKCSPSVIYDRVCPTLRSLPWSQALKSEVSDLCQVYGSRTSKPTFWSGYQGSAATIVFEHGCPNNVPSILWAPQSKRSSWHSLFPGRSVLPPEDSAFPPEIVRRDAITLLVDIGQRRLASRMTPSGPISWNTLLILAYAEKGVRSSGALSFAIGLDEQSCRTLLQGCIDWGFLTSRYRLTPTGLAELEAARRAKTTSIQVASLGTDAYYPKMLRKAT